MRTAASLVILTVALGACAPRNQSAVDGDLSHNPETCTIDGHNHAGEILAATQAEAEDAARDAAWHAREHGERSGQTRPSEPGKAEPAKPKKDDSKDEKPPKPAPRIPPPR